MKKSKELKRVTIIILVIATLSLVFGSFIMLLGQGDNQPKQNTEVVDVTGTGNTSGELLQE